MTNQTSSFWVVLHFIATAACSKYALCHEIRASFYPVGFMRGNLDFFLWRQLNYFFMNSI